MPEKVKMSQEMHDMILQDSGLGHFEMSDRDSACVILPDLDYEAQLIAISALLRRNDPGMGIDASAPRVADRRSIPWAGWRVVTPGYTRAIGLPLLGWPLSFTGMSIVRDPGERTGVRPRQVPIDVVGTFQNKLDRSFNSPAHSNQGHLWIDSSVRIRT
jgi:hypothetical protein